MVSLFVIIKLKTMKLHKYILTLSILGLLSSCSKYGNGPDNDYIEPEIVALCLILVIVASQMERK